MHARMLWKGVQGSATDMRESQHDTSRATEFAGLQKHSALTFCKVFRYYQLLCLLDPVLLSENHGAETKQLPQWYSAWRRRMFGAGYTLTTDHHRPGDGHVKRCLNARQPAYAL